MSSQVQTQRHSTAFTNPRSSQINILQLPEYQPPTHALNHRAEIALRQLQKEKALEELRKHYKSANERVFEASSDLNDRLYMRQRKRKRDQEEGVKGEPAAEPAEQLDDEELEEFGNDVDKKTRAMEIQTRKMLDGMAHLGTMEDSLTHIADVGINKSKQVARQRAQLQSQSQAQTQTQSRRRNRASNSGDENQAEEEDDEIPDPTLPGASSNAASTAAIADLPSLPSIYKLYQERREAENSKYKGLTTAQRYSEHPDYVSFRRTLHDALHGNDGTPVPHASTWFTPDGKPAANLTWGDLQAAQADGEGEHEAANSDDDIEVMRTHVSLKCPITLMPFTNPVTSTSCKHSFEKDAILEMIRGSRGPPDRLQSQGIKRRWAAAEKKYVECPVAACDKVIREDDLREDAYLARKAKQLREQEQDDEEEDEGEGDHTQVVSSSVMGDEVGDDGYEVMDE